MPLSLPHSQAEILRQLLIDLGLGSGTPTATWAVIATNEPASPEKVITIYDTQGRDDGRAMVTGERYEHGGFQIRVRAGLHEAGYQKAREICDSLDTDVYQESVTVGVEEYLIQAITRTTPVIFLGNEPTSKRVLFTINGVVSLRRVSL